jgi:hypothetical protein
MAISLIWKGQIYCRVDIWHFSCIFGLETPDGGKIIMNCPFLAVKYDLTCDANETYAPSRFQLEEYCKGKRDRYTLCPFFKCTTQAEKVLMQERG